MTDIFPAENSEHALRLSLFDNEVESMSLFDPLTGHILTRVHMLLQNEICDV